MPQIGTISSNLPVPFGAGRRFAPAEAPPRSPFVGQLMGRRQRRAACCGAAHLDEGGRLKLRRLPPGYTLDIEA